MKKNFILTSSFAKEIERLEQGLEIKSMDGNVHSSFCEEWFELKDKKTNYTYEYTLYIYSNCIVISENVKYTKSNLYSSIYRIRSRQIVSLWKPLLEKQLKQSKKFRIKYVMQEYEVLLAPLFLEKIAEESVTTWKIFDNKCEVFMALFIPYILAYVTGIIILEKDWLIVTLNVLTTLSFFYLGSKILECKKEAKKINDMLKMLKEKGDE